MLMGSDKIQIPKKSLLSPRAIARQTIQKSREKSVTPTPSPISKGPAESLDIYIDQRGNSNEMMCPYLTSQDGVSGGLMGSLESHPSAIMRHPSPPNGG